MCRVSVLNREEGNLKVHCNWERQFLPNCLGLSCLIPGDPIPLAAFKARSAVCDSAPNCPAIEIVLVTTKLTHQMIHL